MSENSKSPLTYDDHRAFWGLAVVRRWSNGEQRLRVRWWRMLVVGLVGLGAGWLAMAMALYFYFKMYRHFEEVRYVDMISVPFHWAEHQRRLGEYHLRMGDEHFKAKRYNEARQSYNLAVAKLPENLHARQMLAQFSVAEYQQSRNEESLESAFHVLEDGLPYALEDPDYLNFYLRLLVQWHRDSKAIAECEELLQKKPKNPKSVAVLALNWVDLLTIQGRFDQADEVLERYGLTRGLEGTVLAAKVLWERGRRRAAVDFLEQMLKRFPNNDSIYSILSVYYRDLGDLAQARKYILYREIASNSVMPRVEMLYLEAKSGDKDQVTADSAKILEQYGNDANALLALANFATDQGEVDLARRIYSRAIENRFDPAPFTFLLIETYLTAKDYDKALGFIDEIDGEKPEWLAPQKPVLDSLRAVAYYGQGNTEKADVFLARIIKANFPHTETIVAIANRFQQLGGYKEAQELLLVACQVDSNNLQALTQLVNVDLQLGSSTNMEANLRRIMHSRRPPLELIMDAYRKLGGDRFIFVSHRQDLLDEMNHFIENAAAQRQAVEL